MQVKLFTQEIAANAQFLETEVNTFLVTIGRARVIHVSASTSDIERLVSVWYEQRIDQDIAMETSEELNEIIEPSTPGAAFGFDKV